MIYHRVIYFFRDGNSFLLKRCACRRNRLRDPSCRRLPLGVFIHGVAKRNEPNGSENPKEDKEDRLERLVLLFLILIGHGLCDLQKKKVFFFTLIFYSKHIFQIHSIESPCHHTPKQKMMVG